jgi:hypothetical protein
MRVVLSVSIPHTSFHHPGLLVYYQNRGDGDVQNGGSGLKAFPAGFKMIGGSPIRRSRKFVLITSPTDRSMS